MQNQEEYLSKLERYLAEIGDWGYCYCAKCERIRYASELEATERGVRCSKCGGYDLETPGWVNCPHEKSSAVKCARAGRGIVKGEYGYTCELRCTFRKPQE
jgi:hypothetical protein